MFRHKRVRTDNAFSDIPHEPFSHFHSELIGSSLQIPLQTEVHPGSAPVDVVGSERANSTFAKEYTDEGRIVLFGPLLDRERQRISIVFRRIAEFQVTVHRHPGVVKSETEERQLEIKILVDLRHGPVYVGLIVSLVIIATLIEIPIHKLLPDFR